MTAQEVETIISTLTESIKDCEKFDQGNDAAGVRARKALKEASDACKSARSMIQETRKKRKEAKDSVT